MRCRGGDGRSQVELGWPYFAKLRLDFEASVSSISTRKRLPGRSFNGHTEAEAHG